MLLIGQVFGEMLQNLDFIAHKTNNKPQLYGYRSLQCIQKASKPSDSYSVWSKTNSAVNLAVDAEVNEWSETRWF